MPGKAEQLPKSILKKPVQNPGVTDRGQEASTTSRNYRVALQHANLIQARKDVEGLVLEALEELIDFPTSPDASPAAPLRGDVERFRNLIRPFQTSDYDNLFEERNLIDKCAYVFCPRARPHEPHRGPLRLTRGETKGSGFRILSAKKTELWCSKACARRALFIKVQIGESPAWERLGGDLTRPIELLDETVEGELEAKIGSLSIASGHEDELEKAMGQLAMERGEKTAATASANEQVVMPQGLVEKAATGPALAPSTERGCRGGDIEGYQPKAVHTLQK